MSAMSKTEVRYRPTTCTVLRRQVWAILTQEPDGTWRVVNCLDKDEACFSLDCAFTTSGGQWPYASPPRRPSSVPGVPPR